MNTFSSACFYSARTQPSLLFSSSSPQLSIVSKSNQQLSSSIPSPVRLSSRSRVVRAAVEMGTKELERELEEWVGGIDDDGICSSCVGGRDDNNIVEVMECLEREAIMGEDEGREATDYYRRAHIFDKSSRLFQALKDHTTPTQQHY